MNLRAQSWSTIAAVAIAFFCVAVQMIKFSGRGYREDEAWWVHIAWENGPRDVTRLSYTNTSPPAYPLMLTGWQAVHGHAETTTRYFSALILLVGLACVYRLAADLYGVRAGLWAVFLLGTLPIVQFYGAEARNYGLLITTTAASHLLLLRWLHRQRLVYAGLYVVAGTLVMLTHLFGIYVIPAQALWVLLTVEPRLRWRAFGLFAGVGLAYLVGWFPVLIHTVLFRGPGGAAVYATGLPIFAALADEMSTIPAGVGAVLLTLALNAPRALRRRIPLRRAAWYPVGITVLVLLLVLTVNTLRTHANPRNLLILTPMLAVALGGALGMQRRMLQIAVLLVLLVPTIRTFRIFAEDKGFSGVPELLAESGYQPGDRLLVMAHLRATQIALNYYLRARADVAPEQVFHLFPSYEQNRPRLPHDFANVALEGDPVDIDAFKGWLGTASRTFVIWEAAPGSRFAYYNVLDENFARLHDLQTGAMHVEAYYRPANGLAPVFDFDENITLTGWEVNTTTARPCESFSLLSWWRTDAPLSDNYSLNASLVATNGQGLATANAGLTTTLSQQWQPGANYVDDRALHIPCDAVPGAYPLILGVYDPDTLTSLEAAYPDGSVVGAAAFLTNITVEP